MPRPAYRHIKYKHPLKIPPLQNSAPVNPGLVLLCFHPDTVRRIIAAADCTINDISSFNLHPKRLMAGSAPDISFRSRACNTP